MAFLTDSGNYELIVLFTSKCKVKQPENSSDTYLEFSDAEPGNNCADVPARFHKGICAAAVARHDDVIEWTFFSTRVSNALLRIVKLAGQTIDDDVRKKCFFALFDDVESHENQV